MNRQATLWGTMQPESIQLTPQVRVRADGRPPGPAPSWETSSLRRRLLFAPAFGALLLISALVGSAFFFMLTRPYWPGHVNAPAVVTSQTQHYGRGPQCVLGVRFTLDRQTHVGSYELGTRCGGLPTAGTAVTVKVDPADPSNLYIVGLDGYNRKLAYLAPPIGLAILGFGCWVFWEAWSTYRRPNLLVRTQPWRQLTATVTLATTSNRQNLLMLGATDMAGQPCSFQLSYIGPGPWPSQPRKGEVITIWLLADGNRQVLLSGPGADEITYGSIKVPKPKNWSNTPTAAGRRT